jgi:hypothetical protein
MHSATGFSGGLINPGTFRRDWSRGLGRRVFRLDGDHIGGALFSELGSLQHTCSARKKKEKKKTLSRSLLLRRRSKVRTSGRSGKLQLPGWRDPLETESSESININPRRPGSKSFFGFSCLEQRRELSLSSRCRGRSYQVLAASGGLTSVARAGPFPGGAGRGRAEEAAARRKQRSRARPRVSVGAGRLIRCPRAEPGWKRGSSQQPAGLALPGPSPLDGTSAEALASRWRRPSRTRRHGSVLPYPGALAAKSASTSAVVLDPAAYAAGLARDRWSLEGARAKI